MTGNQIKYWDLQEQKRHNQASENVDAFEASVKERDVASQEQRRKDQTTIDSYKLGVDMAEAVLDNINPFKYRMTSDIVKGVMK